MNDYISRDTAICVADYAADEHPYDKDPAKPETFSEYNQGWNDACDYIRERLENAEKADVAPVRRGRWVPVYESEISGWNPEYAGYDPIGDYRCYVCGEDATLDCNDEFLLSSFCPNCGAYMGGTK